MIASEEDDRMFAYSQGSLLYIMDDDDDDDDKKEEKKNKIRIKVKKMSSSSLSE